VATRGDTRFAKSNRVEAARGLGDLGVSTIFTFTPASSIRAQGGSQVNPPQSAAYYYGLIEGAISTAKCVVSHDPLWPFNWCEYALLE
jgi:hypothetical protein